MVYNIPYTWFIIYPIHGIYFRSFSNLTFLLHKNGYRKNLTFFGKSNSITWGKIIPSYKLNTVGQRLNIKVEYFIY